MEQDHILTQDREPIRILGRESALVPRAQAVGPDGCPPIPLLRSDACIGAQARLL